MSNEFEIALWVAHHQRILNLATDIRNSMAVNVSMNEKESEISQIPISTSYSLSTIPEISQVIQNIFIKKFYHVKIILIEYFKLACQISITGRM